jgi:hypothetical protein
MVVSALRQSKNELRDMIISRHALDRLGIPREIATPSSSWPPTSRAS